MSRQSYKKSHSSRKEWEDIFKKNHLAQTLDFVQEKAGQNIIGQGFSARSDFLLGRICNPTAISMSICNYKYEHL